MTGTLGTLAAAPQVQDGPAQARVDLVGDIGATNARFALVDAAGALSCGADLLCHNHATIADAIESYLSSYAGEWPRRAVLAVATTPLDDCVSFANNAWSFSARALAQRLGIDELRIINDFHANALALPHLAADDMRKVGGDDPLPGAPMAILGPGSGLGMSTTVEADGKYHALAGEGGHVTMAPADDRESAVLAALRRHFGHVSAERVLSGPGLINLYGALREIDGKAPRELSAEAITEAAIAGADDDASAAIAMFCAMLGTVAGNLALTVGARGGVYIAGGIVPKLGDTFVHSRFRARFEDKGRFRAYLATIPVCVITRPYAALLGAARLLGDAPHRHPD